MTLKKNLFFALLLLLSFSSCDLKEREENLKAKEAALALREQQLSLREQDIAMREEQLRKLQEKDSLQHVQDSVGVYNELLVGNWNVKMQCTETNCTGSAIGDVKSEQWTIAYENNQVVATAFTKKTLSRVYNGFYTGSQLKISFTDTASAIEMLVELTPEEKDAKKMKGTRAIIKPNCKIVYSIEANKS